MMPQTITLNWEEAKFVWEALGEVTNGWKEEADQLPFNDHNQRRLYEAWTEGRHLMDRIYEELEWDSPLPLVEKEAA